MFRDNTSKEREFILPCPIRLAGLTRRYAALVELPLSGDESSACSSSDGYCEAAETQRLQTLRLVVRILLQSQDDDLVLLSADQRSVLESTLRRSEILLQYIGQKKQCGSSNRTEEDLAVEVTRLSKKDDAGNPLLQWSLVQEDLMEGLDRDQLAAEEVDLFHMADTPIPSAAASATTEHFAKSAATSNLQQLGDAIRQEWGISGCQY